MTALRIYICGGLAVELGQSVVREADFPARQGRRLWAYLVLTRKRPVSRDDAAVAIWGDDVPDTWDVTLNALVSRLRGVLRPLARCEPALAVRGEPGRYTLDLPPGVFVDFERARAAIHDTETLLRRSEPGCALAEARVAMEIANRGFLHGEEAPWIEAQRRTLIDITHRALECTVEAELLRGHPDIAEREARYLLSLDPLRESGYRLLMRALVAGGNVAQTSRVFAECCRLLQEQAGMQPSPETERLYRELTRSATH